ncbi:MAG: hypothetical protein H6618_03500 [Deltaproteobacteria bacterium]|nr:hypothetical protein [Deltaproteobacteria bacterium]
MSMHRHEICYDIFYKILNQSIEMLFRIKSDETRKDLKKTCHSFYKEAWDNALSGSISTGFIRPIDYSREGYQKTHS